MVEIKCDPHIIFYSTELQLIPLFCLKQHRKILFYQQKKLKKQSITLITSVVQAIFYFSYTLFLLAPYFKNSGTLTNSFLHFLRLYSFIASPVLCFCIKSFPSYCDLYDDIYLQITYLLTSIDYCTAQMFTITTAYFFSLLL